MESLKSVREVMRRDIPNFDARCEVYQSAIDEMDEEIMALFVEQMALRLKALEEAIPAREYGSVKWAAHSIKGMGGTVGYAEVSVVAEDMEFAAAEEDLARCSRNLQRLELWFEAFRNEYES